MAELPGLVSAVVEGDLLMINSAQSFNLAQVQQLLPGKFTISEVQSTSEEVASVRPATYKPLIIISLYIVIGSLVLEAFSVDGFSTMDWMRYFMAGFFIVFSFFKLLDLAGFSRSYAMYDIIAAKWTPWGSIYPFVELGLGLLYLTGLFVFELNVLTLIVLLIGSIGVVQSNLRKKQIRCACLGTVFNLPMTKVTIIENAIMIVMAVFGIIMHFSRQG